MGYHSLEEFFFTLANHLKKIRNTVHYNEEIMEHMIKTGLTISELQKEGIAIVEKYNLRLDEPLFGMDE